PVPSTFVDVVVTTNAPPASIKAYRTDGGLVGTVTVSQTQHQTTAHFVQGPSYRAPIARVVITANNGSTFLHRVCYDDVWPSPALAVGYDDQNQIVATSAVVNHVVDLQAPVLSRVVVTSTVETRLTRICVTSAYSEAHELSHHVTEEVERLYDVGDVLKPHTDYRLKIVTQIVATPH